MRFGSRSSRVLTEIDRRLSETAIVAMGYQIIDFSLIEGVRSRARQARLYELGASKVQWPNSRHNITEACQDAMAFDAVPFVRGAESWAHDHILVLAGVMLAAGKSLGYDIRWGGNWDQDGEPITDQTFQDLAHYEIPGGR